MQQYYPSFYTFFLWKPFFPGQTPVPRRSGPWILDLSHDPIWAIWLAEVRKFHQHHDKMINSIRTKVIWIHSSIIMQENCSYNMYLCAMVTLWKIKHSRACLQHVWQKYSLAKVCRHRYSFELCIRYCTLVWWRSIVMKTCINLTWFICFEKVIS